MNKNLQNPSHPVTTRKDEGMIDLEKNKTFIKNIIEKYQTDRSKTSFMLSDFTSNMSEMIQALEEAKEIIERERITNKSIFNWERTKNYKWLSRYFPRKEEV